MTLTLEIPEEVERDLVVLAAANGVAVSELASRLLVEASKQPAPKPPRKPFDRKSFEEALDLLAAHSDQIPLLPEEAFSRESIYHRDDAK
jgi:hypothetical protein